MLKNRVLKANLLYVPTQIIGFMLSLIKGLVLPKLLLPDQYGFLVVIFLMITYSKISAFGVLNAFDMQYPRLLASNNNSVRNEFRDSCFSLCVYHNALFSLGTIIYSVISFHSDMTKMILVAFIAIGMLADNINDFVVDLHRTHRDFSKVSLNRLIGNVINISLIIMGTVFFGLNGAILSIFISNVLMLFYYFRAKDRPNLTRRISHPGSIYKLAIGLFVMLLLSTLIDTLDKIAVVNIYGLYNTGIYNIGSSIAKMPLVAFTALSYVIYPFMLSDYAQNNDRGRLFSNYSKYSLAYFWFAPILLSLCYCFFSGFIPWYLPKYAASLAFIHYLFMAVFWVIFIQLNDTFLLVLNKQKVVIRNQVITVTSAIIMFLVVHVAKLELKSVAIIYLIYAVMYGLMSFYTFVLSLDARWGKATVLLVKYLLPFMFFSIFILFLTKLKPLIETKFRIGWVLQTVISCGLISIFSVPFILFINKEYGLLKEVKLILMQKFNPSGIAKQRITEV
jgi:O-antigen/teichoic acid export membrane protein